MKTARTPTRACRIHSTHASKSPVTERSRMALSQRDSSSEALDLERAALSLSRDRLVRLLRADLPGSARSARSSDLDRTRSNFSAFSTCTSGILPSECMAKEAITIPISPLAKLPILFTKLPLLSSLEDGFKLTCPVDFSYHSGTTRRSRDNQARRRTTQSTPPKIRSPVSTEHTHTHAKIEQKPTHHGKKRRPKQRRARRRHRARPSLLRRRGAAFSSRRRDR